ncbi:hypothetical protein VNI00_016930 [Paramarasmius palmivorus]|uniref:Integral membrane protein n=1 Tax=Paramarasmius palmivorus TaxID=297713 RepID=A0AAW0BAP9_9AGAR
MLLLHALARPIASSLSAASVNDSSSFDPVTGKCIDINDCRTTIGIIWNCLSVVFICTWVAIHPNIPLVEKFDDKKRQWSGHRWHPAALVYQNVELMVIALLSPEIMILWAMRQREQAKKIRNQFKEYEWGMSHGFFVIMGGFALYDGEKFRGYLWDRDRKRECSWQRWKYPYDGLSETCFGEIKDYHRAYQTLENTRNGHARTSESSTPPDDHEATTQETPLPPCSDPENILEFCVAKGYITLTQDEIKDKSHADVITKSIAVTQTIWFIVQVIARAIEGLAITELEIITVGFAILNFGTYFLWWNKPLRVMYPVRAYWRQRENSRGEDADGGNGGIWKVFWEGLGVIMEYIYALKPVIGFGAPGRGIVRLILLPLWIPWHVFGVCLQIIQDEEDRNLAMPISSHLTNDPSHIYIAVYGIAALFGAIHCIPWVFQFPNHTEQLLWRISAVAVAAAPIAMALLHGYWKKVFHDDVPTLLDRTVIILIITLSFAYAVFRITLIVIAFTALRDLPSSAYQTVQWTTFWPHIG